MERRGHTQAKRLQWYHCISLHTMGNHGLQWNAMVFCNGLSDDYQMTIANHCSHWFAMNCNDLQWNAMVCFYHRSLQNITNYCNQWFAMNCTEMQWYSFTIGKPLQSMFCNELQWSTMKCNDLYYIGIVAFKKLKYIAKF